MTVKLIHGEFPECFDTRTPGVFDLVICDPPYGGIVSEKWDVQTGDGYLQLMRDFDPLTLPGGSVLMWGGIGRPKKNEAEKGWAGRPFFDFLARVETELPAWTLQNVITWKKKRAYGKKDDYLFCREECAWLTKGLKPKTFNVPLLSAERGYEGFNEKYPAKSKYLRRSNVWADISELFRGKVHPTEKPETLMDVLIETHSHRGDRVLDPMAGSGVVGSCCYRLQRDVVMCERELDYVVQIKERLRSQIAEARAAGG